MSSDLRTGWFCDHAPGRGKIITGDVTPPASIALVYFEVQPIKVQASPGEDVAVGIANGSFNLNNPMDMDRTSGQYAELDGAVFLDFKAASTVARFAGGSAGGVGIPDTTSFPFALSDWIGVAVDTTNGYVYWRNATQAPAAWHGLANAADPVAVTGGYPYSGANLSGRLFALVGCSTGKSAPQDTHAKINLGATSFAAAAPSGFSAFSSTGVLNPSDKGTYVVLGGGDLDVTISGVPLINGNKLYSVRSVASYAA